MTMASKPLCFFWHLDVSLTLNFSRFSFYFRHCISINLRTGVVHCMFIYMLCLGRKVHFRAKCWTLLRKENRLVLTTPTTAYFHLTMMFVNCRTNPQIELSISLLPARFVEETT